MKKEHMEFSGLAGYLWTPDVPPRATVLALHGMTEHADRFDSFARAMTDEGIAVAAYDLRGHGRNGGDPDCAAMASGDWAKSIQDIDAALKQLRAMFPDGKLFLLGFSLGSFLVREYMQEPDPKMDGVILIGTGHQPKMLLKLIQSIVKSQIRKVGFTGASPLVRKLSFDSYNQKFRPNRTESDWLCSDEGSLDRFLADPLRRRNIAAGTFYELLCAMERTGQPKANGPVPVLLLGGDRDPVGDFGKGTRAVERHLEYARYPVDCVIFPNARHMLLQEEAGGQAQEARTCILNWINKHT